MRHALLPSLLLCLAVVVLGPSVARADEAEAHYRTALAPRPLGRRIRNQRP